MCLESSKPQVSKIAEKNITVYKCMIYIWLAKILQSPYRYTKYKQNIIHIAPTCSLKNEGDFIHLKI